MGHRTEADATILTISFRRVSSDLQSALADRAAALPARLPAQDVQARRVSAKVWPAVCDL